MTGRWAAFPARAPRASARCSTPTLFHARLLVSLVTFVAAVLVGLVGLLGAVSASAASAESTYNTAAYTYNASASLSGPHAATTHARGSPAEPGAAHWVCADSVCGPVVAAKSDSWLLTQLAMRNERGSIGWPGKGTTEAGNRGALNSGKWYDSEEAARRAAERYAAKHPNSCTFRGLCGAGDHYHVDKEINGFLVHTRHYYFPR